MENNIPPPKIVFSFKIVGPKSYFFYVCLKLVPSKQTLTQGCERTSFM